MESQLSVLLYSKYSSLSKSLMNMIQTSGIDFTAKFSLQLLCIDNKEIRARILKNTQLQVTTVPCLLIIFPDGGIEKYDGAFVFEWVEGVIRQFSPPPPPQTTQPQISKEEKWRIQQAREQQRIQQVKENERKRIENDNRRKYHEKYEEERTPSPEREKRHSPSRTPPTRRHRVHKESAEPRRQEPSRDTGVTSIDDLPSDEDDDLAGDRYRSRRPVGRIRADEGNYEEGKELFQGPPPNMRRARRSAVKRESHEGNDAKSQKSADIMAKAKAMAKCREETHAPPPGHPANQRN